MVFIAAGFSLTVSDGFPFTGSVGFRWFSEDCLGCLVLRILAFYWFSGILGVLQDSLDLDIFFRYWICSCFWYKDVKVAPLKETFSTKGGFCATKGRGSGRGGSTGVSCQETLQLLDFVGID